MSIRVDCEGTTTTSKGTRAEDVPCKCSWDCHGLPVEHEIDKAFGKTQLHRDIMQLSSNPGQCLDGLEQALTQCPTCAGINTRSDVIAMCIDKYNEECRSIVMRWVACHPALLDANPRTIHAITSAELT